MITSKTSTTGPGGPKGSKVGNARNSNVLFDINSTSDTSAQVLVNDSPVVILATDLADGQYVQIEISADAQNWVDWAIHGIMVRLSSVNSLIVIPAKMYFRCRLIDIAPGVPVVNYWPFTMFHEFAAMLPIFPPQGDPLRWIPAGGNPDEVLAKASIQNYDVLWRPILRFWTEGFNDIAPNDIIPVNFWFPSSGLGDIDVALPPVGNGSFLLQMPDGLVSFGNKRGLRTVDLQRFRTFANRVASGDDSSISGGTNNQAAGIGSHVGGGRANVATGLESTVGGGLLNSASGDHSTVGGGRENGHFGIAGASAGGYGALGITDGAFHHSSKHRTTIGDSQLGEYVISATTIDATPTQLTVGGAVAAGRNRPLIRALRSWTFDGLLVAREAGVGVRRASIKFEGSIYIGATGASVVLDANTVTNIFNPSALGLAITVADALTDGLEGELILTVTGIAASTFGWVARVRTVEIYQP